MDFFSSHKKENESAKTLKNRHTNNGGFVFVRVDPKMAIDLKKFKKTKL